MKQENKADVVIAGAGLAGIVTALELLDANKSVILLDRDKEENFGGLAKESFGGMFFVDTKNQKKSGYKDSTDLALSDWHTFAEFEEKDYWPKKWAEQYVHYCTPHVHDYLVKRGISYFPVVHWVERGLFKPGNSVPRFHMVWGTGHGLVTTLIGHLMNHSNKAKLSVRFGHYVQKILDQNGRVTGLSGIIEASGEEWQVYGENTVVATGGFCGDVERVKRQWYKPWGEPPEKILNGSHHFATGELHDRAADLNANLTHMDKMWNYAAGVHHPRPKRPNHGLSIVPPKSALWVDSRGKRFGPMPLVSAYDTRYLCEVISKQKDKKYSWQIMNMKIALKELAVSGSEFNDAIREKKKFQFVKTILMGNAKLVNFLVKECEDFIIANSVEELVEKMNALTGTKNVDLKTLKKDIADYDAAIDRGVKYHNDEQLRRVAHLRQYRGDRVRLTKFQKIVDQKAMPLIAIREFILSRKSLGGVQTDLGCRVMTIPDVTGNQNPIEGLYCVGEAAGFGGGGVHGMRALEGTFLGGCVLTGRMAAKTITGKSSL